MLYTTYSDSGLTIEEVSTSLTSTAVEETFANTTIEEPSEIDTTEEVQQVGDSRGREDEGEFGKTAKSVSLLNEDPTNTPINYIVEEAVSPSIYEEARESRSGFSSLLHELYSLSLFGGDDQQSDYMTDSEEDFETSESLSTHLSSLMIPADMPYSSAEEKVYMLVMKLVSDPLGCDAKWTLFMTAAMSYRYDCCLDPFPPDYTLADGSCDIVSLINELKDTPKLQQVVYCLLHERYTEVSAEILNILHFVLVQCGSVSLRTLSARECDSMIQHIGQQMDQNARPSHVFEVIYAENATPQRPADSRIIWGFHGDCLERFYKHMHRGFAEEDGERSDFMSKKLHIALTYSPSDPGWGASACGPLVSCVGLCECVVTSSEADPAVTSNASRLRYLLFYGAALEEEVADQTENTSAIRGWILEAQRKCIYTHWWLKQNRNALLMLGYGVLVTSMAMTNRSVKDVCRRLGEHMCHSVAGFLKRLVTAV